MQLVTPLLADQSAQAKAGAGYDRTAFAIDFDAQRATCPHGQVSSTWNDSVQNGRPAIVVTFAAATCRPCPVRADCTKAATGVHRARYLGIDKIRLEHHLDAAAINLIRLDVYYTGRPLDRGHTSHLARLDFTLAA